jgi:6-phosphogluconolactonase
MKQSYQLAGACFSAALLAACGGTVTNSPSVPSATQAQNQTQAGGPIFAYVTDVASKNLSAYAVNPATGALKPVRRSPFRTREDPWGVAVFPDKFVYVANGVGTNQYSHHRSTVTALRINANGVLSRVADSPFKDTGDGAADMVVTGKFAYVVNIYSGDVSAYTINTVSGMLTPVMGSPFGAGGEPESLTIDPKGKFVYVPNTLSNDVSAFKINASTGALKQVKGSPYSAGTTPAGVAVDSTGSFAYVTNANSNNISAYTIDPTSGALTPVVGSPFASDTPSRVAADPRGGFVYVSNNGSDTVSGFAIDPASGALTPVAGSPFATGSGPGGVAVDPTGSFAYVTNGGSNNISAYTIDATSGTLTPVVGSPFAAGNTPISIIVRR